ncbi:ADP-forming succinate--CoA ligase subunit beta [Candidatus Odyssella acanthamoebae]|uniref:Succinate--CoA ligase [ADP-forming] subunit beta n=1 Tax=Candidatus Odyssella acanthamoebae TaxID=91604 RepID=A0A077AUN3_9PROT|nr:ADP-forming succinate--CoA ligase subunit beta [Candidatus Paracaedibacter acanthamoebae]AIK95739.1 succinyl-CoA synthetase subunit beta [Candidatus Paracaedibacter acanthamoebae]
MNIHEYQAKEVLKKYGAPVSAGKVAFTVQEAATAAKELGGSLWVVKAQIHAGGRGKAGGVILCRTVEEVSAAATKLLGLTLVTHQTGPKGQVVRKVYVESGCNIDRELYVSLVLERNSGRVAVIASQAGGMDIEEVAAKTPEKIIQFSFDPSTGYKSYHGRKLAYALGLEGDAQKQMLKLAEALVKSYCELDCTQIEINPLVVTKEGNLIVLDAKVSFDDNALFRHPDIESLRDLAEEDPAETEAHKHELNYVKLDGTIGCMVNGAGLAMATMDIIKLHGGEPANFLDVGGGATKERVSEAFKLILADQNVKAVLVNIFGGIMKCDVIAEGIVAAAKDIQLNVPMVVRLQGTNMEQGRKILNESGLKIISEGDLTQAAAKVVAAIKEAA